MDDDDNPILDKELIIRIEENIQEDEVETDILPMIDEAIYPDEDNNDIDIFEKKILDYLRDRLISIFKKRVRSKN